MHLAAQEGRHPEAAADPHEHEFLQAPRGPGGTLGQSGQVDVVLDDHRAVQRTAQCAEDALVPVGQVDRETRIAGLRVDDARAPDHERAQPARLHAGGPAGTVDRTANQPDRVGRTVRADADLGDHAPGDVGDPGAHSVGFHVEPGDVGAGGDDGVESGVRPAAAFLLADDRDQAAFLQPGQHLGHGDLGDPGLLAELGPGQRSSGEQQFKGGAVVELAQQTWRTRSALHRGLSPCALAQCHGSRISIRQRHYLIGKFPISFLSTAMSLHPYSVPRGGRTASSETPENLSPGTPRTLVRPGSARWRFARRARHSGAAARTRAAGSCPVFAQAATVTQISPFNAKNWATAGNRDQIIPTMMKSLMREANFTATVNNVNPQLQNVLNTGSKS